MSDLLSREAAIAQLHHDYSGEDEQWTTARSRLPRRPVGTFNYAPPPWWPDEAEAEEGEE